MAEKTATQHNAAIDAQKMPTTTFVSGTVGTADTTGTAEIVRGAANPTTGAQYVHILGTSVEVGGGGSVVNIATGTLQTSGLGTVVGNVASGVAATNNPVRVGGTDAGGTVYGQKVDTSGNAFVYLATKLDSTNDSVTVGGGTIQNLNNGTLAAVTTVTNLTSGSVQMTVGTLTTGSLTNLASLHTGTITTGSLTIWLVYTQVP